MVPTRGEQRPGSHGRGRRQGAAFTTCLGGRAQGGWALSSAGTRFLGPRGAPSGTSVSMPCAAFCLCGASSVGHGPGPFSIETPGVMEPSLGRLLPVCSGRDRAGDRPPESLPSPPRSGLGGWRQGSLISDCPLRGWDTAAFEGPRALGRPLGRACAGAGAMRAQGSWSGFGQAAAGALCSRSVWCALQPGEQALEQQRLSGVPSAPRTPGSGQAAHRRLWWLGRPLKP